MVEIDPTLIKYSVRFKRKDRRQNQRDDKIEVMRMIAGIRDTNNILDVQKESERTKQSDIKHNKNFVKDKQTISDINLFDIPLIHVKLTKEQAAALRRHPDVLYVEPPKMRKAFAETIPWGISRMGASSVSETSYHAGGKGVRVAVLDTGVDYNHTDLSPNFKGGASMVDYTTNVMDDNSVEKVYHGTHVSGTICAAKNNAYVVGMVPNVSLYAIKVLDQAGSGSNQDITEGLVWAATNNMNVLNFSLGGTAFDQAEADGVKRNYDQGAFVTASAGNDGQLLVNYPAGYAGAWCVGSIDQVDSISDFSDWGPVGHVKFVAPGGGNGFTDIESDMPGNKTQMHQGTSMAAPHISGIAAMGFANYRFSPCDTYVYAPQYSRLLHILGAMIDSCDTLGQTSKGVQNQFYGFGLPQCQAMLDLLMPY